jgi:uncharacterized membrane protein YbhN (UPF0104 family)
MEAMSLRTMWRPFAVITIVTATVLAFVRYFAHHPEIRTQLGNTSPALLALLFGLYLLFVGSLALINSATLRLCGTQLTGRESLLLTAYSSVINFFGPLQSGPAFRAAYLKKQHGTALKKYGTATLMYYLFYAFFSGLFLLSSTLGWYLLLLGALVVLIGAASYKWSLGPLQKLRALNLKAWYYLAVATLLQVSIQAIIYYAELRSITPGVHVGQVIVYTGAANFALFVSITPGAIGFRESFLLFSQHLHHISSSAIVLATTLDRAAYIMVLVVMAVVIFGTHAQKKLKS